MSKNKKNVIISILSQIVILSLGFIVPRLVLVNYGSDTNGMMSTITQIFTYMALLEAGIGQATRNELYHYINRNNYNKNEISKVMSVSRRYFRKFSIIYAASIIFLSLIAPFLLKSNLSYFTIALYILIEGATGVLSYFFIQTWSTILTADGKQYVSSNIELLNRILCYGVKILLASRGINILYIELGYFVVSLVKLIIYKIYMDRHYSWIKYDIDTGSRKLSDRNSFVITEVAWTIFSSTDMIVLSVFASTSLSSVYSVYNMIFVSINSLITALYASLKFNLGQTYNSDIESYKKVHDSFNSIFVGLMTLLLSVAYITIIPFVKLYTSGIEDVEYIYALLPLGFCLVQLLSWSRMVSGNLSGMAGYAKAVSKVSIVEAIINLSFSVILVNLFGIYGVIFATVIALPIKVVYCNYLADKKIMNRSLNNTIRILGVNWLLFGGVVFISCFINVEIVSYFHWLIFASVVFVVCGFIIVTINLLINRTLFVGLKNKVRSAFRKGQ